MNSARIGMTLAGVLACALSAAGCSHEPLVLSTSYTGSERSVRALEGISPHGDAAGPVCRVRLAEVRDVRDDPQAMGTIGGRAVRTPDSVAWAKSAFSLLERNKRIRFVADGEEADLTLRVELLKAYVLNITEAKSSNVVLRVTFSRKGKDDELQIERGRDTGLNWANGDDETQSSLDDALAHAVSQVDFDIAARCKAG